MKLDALKKSIHELEMCEAKHYLIHLCATLENDRNHKKLKNQDPIIAQTQRVVNDIQAIYLSSNAPSFDKSKLPDLINTLNTDYQALYNLSKIGNYSKRTKQAVLQLCGLIAGFIVALPLGLIGMTYWFFAVKTNYREAFKSLHLYFLTGAASGVVLSFRFFESFENKLDRQLRYSLHGLTESFQTLTNAAQTNLVNTEKEAQLQEFFGDDAAAKEAFLKSKHPYQLIGFKAAFLSSHLKGYVGQHSVIAYEINGKKQVIELGSPSLEEIKHPEQLFDRTCSGEELLTMCTVNRILKKQWATSCYGLKHYKAVENDCKTYLDVVLASANQPLCKLERSIETDAPIGKAICRLMKKYSIFSETPGTDLKEVNTPIKPTKQ
jgi:hypothetical protein